MRRPEPSERGQDFESSAAAIELQRMREPDRAGGPLDGWREAAGRRHRVDAAHLGLLRALEIEVVPVAERQHRAVVVPSTGIAVHVSVSESKTHTSA